MRAKFRVNMITPQFDNNTATPNQIREDIVANAVYDPDPNGANRDWSLYTPAGTLNMAITNPGAFGHFIVGQEIYVTLTPVEARV